MSDAKSRPAKIHSTQLKCQEWSARAILSAFPFSPLFSFSISIYFIILLFGEFSNKTTTNDDDAATAATVAGCCTTHKTVSNLGICPFLMHTSAHTYNHTTQFTSSQPLSPTHSASRHALVVGVATGECVHVPYILFLVLICGRRICAIFNKTHTQMAHQSAGSTRPPKMK